MTPEQYQDALTAQNATAIDKYLDLVSAARMGMSINGFKNPGKIEKQRTKQIKSLEHKRLSYLKIADSLLPDAKKVEADREKLKSFFQSQVKATNV
jgi:hypothetical protein